MNPGYTGIFHGPVPATIRALILHTYFQFYSDDLQLQKLRLVATRIIVHFPETTNTHVGPHDPALNIRHTTTNLRRLRVTTGPSVLSKHVKYGNRDFLAVRENVTFDRRGGRLDSNHRSQTSKKSAKSSVPAKT